MVNTPQISINATTFGRFTTKARKNVTILASKRYICELLYYFMPIFHNKSARNFSLPRRVVCVVTDTKPIEIARDCNRGKMSQVR